MVTNSDVRYVIVQAGGKGTRLGRYAANRPKCLLPVGGKPIIEHALDVYAGKTVIIVGDYLFDVLRDYLAGISKRTNYVLVRTSSSGTAAGMTEAVGLVPDGDPFIITWSDLLFEKEQEFGFDTRLLIGLSGDFECRWSLSGDNRLVNEPSKERGVAGFFVFRDKAGFEGLTTDKSFVRGFLSDEYGPGQVSAFTCQGCMEVGSVGKYEEILGRKVNHRFFNEVRIEGDRVCKRCVDPKYDEVHDAEREWYRYVSGKFARIPEVCSTEPLVLGRIDGRHCWEISRDRDKIIANCCDAICQLHSIESSEPNPRDCMAVYLEKPCQRVAEVACVLRHVSSPVIRINGRDCRNPMCDPEGFGAAIGALANGVHRYAIIHGDITFSNVLVDGRNDTWMIDPRGTFGGTRIHGDPRYDWAKLYYSAAGNYDSINSGNFAVELSPSGVGLSIRSNGYEEYGDYIIGRSGMTGREMGLIHAGIWLSLTGYVKEDIEASMYAFYRGCELWTEATSRD